MMLEGEEVPLAAPVEAAPAEALPAVVTPPSAPKIEDYIMFREGNLFFYLSLGYIIFELSIFALIALSVYFKLRLEAEHINWQMEEFVLSMDTVENLKINI